jgi:endoglucanase
VNLSNWLANAERQPLYERDFVQIKKAGFDNVRIPVKPELLESDFTAADHAINLALKNNLAAVLDLHPGKDFMQQLENNPRAEEKFIALWSRVADHYRNYPSDQLVFELLNEPQYYGYEDQYNALMQKTVAAIRKVDSKRTIIIGAPRGSSIDALAKLKPIQDAHTLYAFHFYEPYMITHQGIHRGFENKMLRYFHDVPYPSDLANRTADSYAQNAANPQQAQAELTEYIAAKWNRQHIADRMKAARQWADKYHIRIICGEFGVLRNHIDPQSRYRWIEDTRKALEENHIGWQIWDYSDLDGITTLTGKTSTDKVDGSVRFLDPQSGQRVLEKAAIKALALTTIANN